MLGPRARFGIVRSSRSAQSSLRVLLDGGAICPYTYFL
jgi:hypothetical protein